MMETSLACAAAPASTLPRREAALEQATAALNEAFGVTFTVLDGESGRAVTGSAARCGDELYRAELIRQMYPSGKPALIDEADPLVLLALPLPGGAEELAGLVAVNAFVTRAVAADETLAAAARLLGCTAEEARAWIVQQPIWPAAALERIAPVVLEKLELENRNRFLQREVEQVSQNLTQTYEEICLLYNLTQHLRISSSEEQLGETALEWLLECLPVRSVAIQYLPVAHDEEVTYRTRMESVLLTRGEAILTSEQITQLTASLGLGPDSGPCVVNPPRTTSGEWPFPDVRQLILIPLAEGEHLFGWLAAINHDQELEFGTVEANLLSSVAAILGIHTANRELYRSQAEFLANVVRALTSAIDAKDPYTCGHSDRVARIAVRLAREMDCPSNVLNTLYMAGLLHDIGKIGIDDQVLRKPGRLTEAEFEHIKMHPELGYRILADLRPLSEVLPVVLHHHEQWDGGGYPGKLRGEETPLLARITAVADAFDAMTSDRPYRKGLPIERVEEIFRQGAGQQWDREVVAAFFRCRDDILDISRRERENLSLDVEQWRD